MGGNGGRSRGVWLGTVRTLALTLGNREPWRVPRRGGTDLIGW